VLLRLLLLAELNNIIRNKDDEITNLKNLVYRRSDNAEKLIQALPDVDVQLVECMTQIKKMIAAGEVDSSPPRCRCTTHGVYDTDQGDDRCKRAK
jgi:hypothetical protein